MRKTISIFDVQYRQQYERSVRFVNEVPAELLYRKTAEDGDLMMKLTVGQNIIRSASFVEMTFGGITTRLWDDPFEWTLTEELSDAAKIIAYLSEVEETRSRGFGFFISDDDLDRTIPAPRELRSLGEILLDTLVRAEHYQGRAFALYQTLTSNKLRPR